MNLHFWLRLGCYASHKMSDRKYRQSGYQDSGDRPKDRRSAPARPRDPLTGPRGRGLGKPTATVTRCAVCGAEQSRGEIDVAAVCAKCGTDLHTCTHCLSFDASAPNECRQAIAVRITSKAKRNQCESFSAKQAQEQAKDSGPPDDPRSAFDALFDF